MALIQLQRQGDDGERNAHRTDEALSAHSLVLKNQMVLKSRNLWEVDFSLYF